MTSFTLALLPCPEVFHKANFPPLIQLKVLGFQSDFWLVSLNIYFTMRFYLYLAVAVCLIIIFQQPLLSTDLGAIPGSRCGSWELSGIQFTS